MRFRSFLLIALALCLLFCVVGCKDDGVRIVYDDEQPQNPKPMNKREDPFVQIGYYSYGGWGLDMTLIGGSTAKEVIELLASLTPTGEVVPALSETSNEEFIERQRDDACEQGTWFVDTGERIYRLTPDETHLYVSDRYLGAGEELSFEKELISYLQTIATCWPYDYWQGIYSDGVLTVRHRYLADSDVTITVKAIDFGEKKATEGSITLELVAKTDLSTVVRIETDGGGCIVYADKVRAVDLTAGKPKLITMAFDKADSFYYSVYITADGTNTKIGLRIQ